MAESKKVLFGSDYNYDFQKSPLENWKDMKEYYLEKKGLDIGDFPVMTKEEEEELSKQLENIK